MKTIAGRLDKEIQQREFTVQANEKKKKEKKKKKFLVTTLISRGKKNENELLNINEIF